MIEIEEIEKKTYTIFDDFRPLIEKLPDYPDAEQLANILIKIPSENPELKKQVLDYIKSTTKLGLSTIKERYRILHPKKKISYSPPSEKVLQQCVNYLQEKYINNKYIAYRTPNRYFIIEITKKDINLIEINKFDAKVEIEDEVPIRICNFSLNLLFKTKDRKKENIDLYTFTANNNLFYNFDLGDFLKLYRNKIIEHPLGDNVIRYIVNELSKNISERRGKYVLGFKNGWYLPLHEKENKYSLICYTDEQKRVLKQCRKIYKKYTELEKEQLCKKLKRFIIRTQMPKPYKAIMIGFSIIAPFKLFFIENFGLFPHLIAEGELNAGKTEFLDAIITHFYNQYKKHESGDSAKSSARFPDLLSGSTLPVMIDDFKDVPPTIINIMKEAATSDSDYKRKLGVIEQITRSKVAPLAITSNDLGKHFSDPANSSRAIVLNFSYAVVTDLIWTKLKNELKKEKLFSLIYDYTKNWTNDDFEYLLNEVEIKFNIDEQIKKIERESFKIISIEKDYPRLIKVYKIILTGILLFEKIFHIKLKTNNVLKTLIKIRRHVSEDLLDKFIPFCEQAVHFDPIRHPKYITVPLIETKMGNFLFFTQTNLRDFNEFNSSKYSMSELLRELKEGLTNKNLIKRVSLNLEGYPKQLNGLKIEKELVLNFDELSSIDKIKSVKKIDDFFNPH